mmetsp:Transcript_1720/g.4113  ORF Transcript_1720/g.4113 Transcript_1720/m.4113 type:complete len:264 (+) Transcript_1720:22-813(+)
MPVNVKKAPSKSRSHNDSSSLERDEQSEDRLRWVASRGCFTLVPFSLLPKEEILVGEPCFVSYVPNFLNLADADDVFRRLRDEVPWKRVEDDYGVQDRLTAYWGDPGCVFAYVGIQCQPEPWHPAAEKVRDKLNATLGTRHGANPITACLCNNYEDKAGKIDWHFDEMRAHGPAQLVVSVTLGSARRIYLKPRDGKGDDEVISQLLEPGSAFIMAAETQDHFLHSLPLEPGAGQRIALTFRSIVPGWEEKYGTTRTGLCTDGK